MRFRRKMYKKAISALDVFRILFLFYNSDTVLILKRTQNICIVQWTQQYLWRVWRCSSVKQKLIGSIEIQVRVWVRWLGLLSLSMFEDIYLLLGRHQKSWRWHCLSATGRKYILTVGPPKNKRNGNIKQNKLWMFRIKFCRRGRGKR